ncbi:MAG: alpha-L-rhamnosidase C-terminal domain-containing protein [Lentisphaeria bacterium]|nr:alpha-L-rhamnosidase C-terminal domain-containing protein [Lentisphaeria bacterium]
MVLSGTPGDVVDIVFGEHCLDGEVIAYESNHRRNTSTLILDGSSSRRWVSSLPKGFRYYMIVARSVQHELSITQVGACHEAMDVRSNSSFSCSLPQLEAIWAIGAQTLSSTVHRVFMDSPTKDQAQCIPDAMIQSWASYYVFGTYQQTSMAIEAFARAQLETGEMNALCPSGLFQAVPDFSLNWPVWLHRHILHTGDVTFLKKMLPALQNLLYYFDQLAVSHDGPLGDLHEYLGTYCFLDHGAIDREGMVTGLNAIYCRALLSAAWLATYAQEPALATQYKNRASQVASQVRALCWDAQEGLFADSYHDGAKSPFFSWQTNVLAIYGGIAEPSQYQAIWDRFFINDVPLEQFAGGEYNNPYFKYYLLEAAFALGKNSWALRLIHYYWGRMAKAGATSWWELFDPDNPSLQKRMCSQCCGNGTSPNGFLITELVGIRPAEPGMHMVYFNPMPGDVTWVKAHIPTPNGYIYVDWNIRADGVFAASISANYPLEVIPILNPGIAESAIITVSEKVAILAQE